jgi:hypothetical protein
MIGILEVEGAKPTRVNIEFNRTWILIARDRWLEITSTA